MTTVVTSVIVALIAAVAPAHATDVDTDRALTVQEEDCRGNTMAFSNGGNTVWRNITMQTCIEAFTGGGHRAHIKMLTGAKGGNKSQNIFYHVFINVRLERYDVDIEANSCDVTIYGNATSPYGWVMNCYTPAVYSLPSGGWTSDGNISYDIIGDGRGDLTWSLAGSPMVD